MFEVGQRVWSVRSGFGEVIRIDTGPKDNYPVVVKHESMDTEYYTLDGRLYEEDLRPTLFLDEPKEWPNPPAPPKPLPDLAIDTPVWVKFWGNDRWFARHFAKWDTGKMLVFLDGKTSHSSYSVSEVNEWVLEKPK